MYHFPVEWEILGKRWRIALNIKSPCTESVYMNVLKAVDDTRQGTILMTHSVIIIHSEGTVERNLESPTSGWMRRPCRHMNITHTPQISQNLRESGNLNLSMVADKWHINSLCWLTGNFLSFESYKDNNHLRVEISPLRPKLFGNKHKHKESYYRQLDGLIISVILSRTLD